ncbi:MAG: hypothetical protein GEU98_07765 [Pseudonocardiaceae bacterium]|nr:hypothetical protein [Pseudonocardiaceae bacterium]
MILPDQVSAELIVNLREAIARKLKTGRVAVTSAAQHADLDRWHAETLRTLGTEAPDLRRVVLTGRMSLVVAEWQLAQRKRWRQS